MGLIWVTGVPGSGKSTVARELRHRGLPSWDADDGIAVWRDRESGVVVGTGPRPRPPEWSERYGWVLDTDKVEEVAASLGSETGFLCGSVENEVGVWHLFSGVVCLTVDRATLVRRIAARHPPDYGTEPGELDLILGWNETVAQQYRGYGATVIDGAMPLDVVVDAIVAVARRSDHNR